MLTLPTTTGSILRPADGDPYESAATTTLVQGLAAHLSDPTGSEIDLGGQQERIDAVLLTQPDIDLRHTDLWRDDPTGDLYRVAWVQPRRGLGLDHTKAGLVRFDGAATGG